MSVIRALTIDSFASWLIYLPIGFIHLSNIGSIYWKKQHQNAPCHILQMSVNGMSPDLVVDNLVIKLSR
jgi:hypothetical protein